MTTKEMITVMQASEEGKTIEYRRSEINPDWTKGETWAENGSPGWDWVNYDYRVKPEPLEIELWVSPEGIIGRRVEKDDKIINHQWMKKKFREVIE